MPTPYSHLTPHPARSWIRDSLKNERWFGNAPPEWQNMPSSQSADVERQKRVRLLKKHGLRKLSLHLSKCSERRRCLSGCCPECGRALQRLVVANATALLRPPGEFVVASIVPLSKTSPYSLNSLDIEVVRRRLVRALTKGGVQLALAGFDFSLNEKSRGGRAIWTPHVWAFVHELNRSRWEMVLRRKMSSSTRVPRPVRLEQWDGRVAAIGYMLKTHFVRRIGTTTKRRNVDGIQTCRNTTNDRLRSAESAELFEFLDRIGLEGRLILLGISIQDGRLTLLE